MSVIIDRRADDLVADEYEKHRAEVGRLVAHRLEDAGIQFTATVIDSFYNQAWHGVFARLQTTDEIGNLETLLAETTYRRAVDEYRAMNPERRTDHEVLEALGLSDPIAQTPEQQKALRDTSEELRSGTSQRELQPAALCYVYGLPQLDVWDRLGIGLDRLEAIVDELTSEIEPALEGLEEGEWCDDRAPLINQYALGVFEPRSDEYREAVKHLKECAGCRRHAIGSRAVTAITVPSGQMLIALTGSLNLGAGVAPVPTGPAPGFPRAASPITSVGAKRPRNRAKVAAMIAAAAIVLFGGFSLLSGGDGSSEDSAADTAAVSSTTASEKAKAKAAKAKRKARAAKKRRAERRDEARARARARKRAAARRAAAAQPAQTNASVPATVTPQVQQQVQSVPQIQTKAPTQQSTPKPSTDPSQEFGSK